jgi:hypothetical protein
VNGYTKPSNDLQERLAQHLEVSVDELFVDDPDDVVVAFVKRTTGTSNVPERVEDTTAIQETARVLRGGAA